MTVTRRTLRADGNKTRDNPQQGTDRYERSFRFVLNRVSNGLIEVPIIRTASQTGCMRAIRGSK